MEIDRLIVIDAGKEVDGDKTALFVKFFLNQKIKRINMMSL